MGDQVYAGKQWRNLSGEHCAAACRDFPRQALHAWKLSITRPASADPMTFEAPVSADIEGLLATLRGVTTHEGA